MSDLSSSLVPPYEPVLAVNGEHKIGVISPCYGLEKVSYALRPTGYIYYKLRTVPLKKLPSKSNFFEKTPLLWPTRTNLVHTFNEIPMNGPPFIVSFELEFPRLFGSVSDVQTSFTNRLLRSSRCAAILGLSNIAASKVRERYEDAGEYEIANKIDVFRGGIKQNCAPANVAKSNSDDTLQLLFVGNSILRKGLLACAMSIGRLIDKGCNVKINIISNLDRGGYVASWCEHSESILQEFLQRSEVTLVGSVPNSQVLEYMQRSDVLLFPTIDESLGWTPIEAGMTGTPTIATNVFAIPEFIEHGESGLLIDVPLNETTGRWIGIEHPDKQRLFLDAQELLSVKIESAVEYFLNNPTEITRMGLNAQNFMREQYSEERAAKTLESIYGQYA